MMPTMMMVMVQTITLLWQDKTQKWTLMKEKAKYTQKIQLSNCFQKILKAETFDTDMTSALLIMTVASQGFQDIWQRWTLYFLTFQIWREQDKRNILVTI